MNLAEFPLCALAHRLKPEVKTLRFEDQVFDRGRNEWITRKLTVTGSDAYGLPTEKDDEVLLGLIQLTQQHGFSDRKVPFTRHELIRMIGWRDDSKSYARVEASLNRWTGVTLFYDKAWWNKKSKCWMKEAFHILDNVWLCHRGDPPPDTGLQAAGSPVSAFVWNEVVFRSFTHGYLKSIDYEFFKSLKSAVAKRLYRFLDKRFWRAKRLEFDLREFCCEHIGLSRNYDAANLKRKLSSGIRELESRGFLRVISPTRRFAKVRRGQWSVLFESASTATIRLSPETSTQNVAQTQGLIDRGVAPNAALQIVADFPTDRIARQIKSFDSLLHRKDAKVSRNPAGFLIASIKCDFVSAQESQSDAKKVHASGPKASPNLRCAAKCDRKDTAELGDPARFRAMLAQSFWNSLSPEVKGRMEREALSQVSPFQNSILQGNGAIARAARMLLLERFALRFVCPLPAPH